MKRLGFTLLFAGVCCATAAAREVEETFPNGQVRLRYTVDADGRKDGRAVEYHDNGKVKVRSEYRAGQLDGPYTTFYEKGQPHVSAGYKRGKLDGDYTERTVAGQPFLTAGYHDGKLHGWRVNYNQGVPTQAQAWKDGELVAARGVEQVKRTLADIEREPDDADKLDALSRNRAAALRRLKAYRYLTGVPHEDLELDNELNRYAEAASQICKKLGRLEHAPPNPGMSEDEYRVARKGAGSSNLFAGLTDFVKCVDGWMDDTDPSNIAYLGHRRWCLHPPIKKTGFGRDGKFAAMYVFDRSRKEPFDYDYISFPGRGVMPDSYFGRQMAWSITLNPKKYRPLTDSVRVKVTPLDEHFDSAGDPLEVAGLHFDNEGFGVPSCVIFQPKKVEVGSGSRYWVELEGIRQTDGKATAVRFLVEFVSLK